MQDRNLTALNKFISIMSVCRHQLISDVMEENPDLYKFLYEDRNKKIVELYKRCYELKWLESHLLECEKILTATDFSIATKRELLRIFLQWYQKFLAEWGYNSTDAIFFRAEIESLENLIDTNQNWENDFKKLQVSFQRETKILEKQIEEAIDNGGA